MGCAGDEVRWGWYPLDALKTWEDLPSSQRSSKAGLIGERGVGGGSWGWNPHEPVPLSIIHTSSCRSVLLPSLRLMAFGGAAPKSHNQGGGWVVGCRAQKGTLPAFSTHPCNKNQQVGADDTRDLCCPGPHPGLEKGALGGDLMHMMLPRASS